MPAQYQNRGTAPLFFKGHAIEAVLVRLLAGDGHRLEVVPLPDPIADGLVRIIQRVAPVILVEIDVAVVPFHQVPDEVGVVDSRIGLDGILPPQEKHRRDMGHDNGPVWYFSYEFM